ncbi:MAG: M23 family metallopeptidase [Desulfobacterales bacterium]|nr:M23 family metallopeptidase [Desulfobacterales bacterium]
MKANSNKKKIVLKLILLTCLLTLIPIIWWLLVMLEGGKPSIELDLAGRFIGESQEINIKVSDKETGIRKLWIGLYKNGREHILEKKEFPFAGFIKGGAVHEDSINLFIEPKKLGTTDGKAILRMFISDYSWRGWWHGNKTYVEKEVVIDTLPPEVDIITRNQNMNQGGSGLVIYRVLESGTKNGVYVDGNFFPGHKGPFKDENICMSFFALNHKQGEVKELFVQAVDQAGNTARAGFSYHINKKRFKKDVINISDKFLNWKMPEFYLGGSKGSKISIEDKFIKVNRVIRSSNSNKLTGLGEKTENSIYWDGAFLRLPRSAKKAGYADYRSYQYKGRIIDRQYHLGVDLASVAHSPIPSANGGKVIFTEKTGIFGKTIVIDHGFGLLSLYSHLSSFKVKPGDIVSKGDILGHTGVTGLAGGDHLHFGMIVHNTFVNPIEWWDATWIKNNIQSKINNVKLSAE